MNREEKYNGYTNKPTWIVSLWIQNDEGLYNLVRDLIKASKREGENPAERLKDLIFEESEVIGQVSMESDLLEYAYTLVNWDEVVEALSEDEEEEEEHE